MSVTGARGHGSTDHGPALTLDEILAVLPHRSPFLMVDRVVERRQGHSCLALKRVTFGDPCIRTGEGPALPELNPLFLVEAMSQTAALAVAEPGGGAVAAPLVGYLAAIQDFRCRRPAVPGDTLEIRVEVVGRFGGLVKVRGTVDVDGERIGEAELTLSVPREVERG
jgi:3-hydroxyacyl-[acyl-carrier-protein] dehydratase